MAGLRRIFLKPSETHHLLTNPLFDHPRAHEAGAPGFGGKVREKEIRMSDKTYRLLVLGLMVVTIIVTILVA